MESSAGLHLHGAVWGAHGHPGLFLAGVNQSPSTAETALRSLGNA